MKIPAAHGAMLLAVLPLPWEKELKSHRVCFGVVELRASLPVCLFRQRGAAKLGDNPGRPFPTWILSQTWLMLPAEVGQGEAQGSHIQQQPVFGLCNFGQAAGLQGPFQVAGVIAVPCPS